MVFLCVVFGKVDFTFSFLMNFGRDLAIFLLQNAKLYDPKIQIQDL